MVPEASKTARFAWATVTFGCAVAAVSLWIDLALGLYCVAAYAKHHDLGFGQAFTATYAMRALHEAAFAGGLGLVAAFLRWRARQQGTTPSRKWRWAVGAASVGIFAAKAATLAPAAATGLCDGQAPILTGPAELHLPAYLHEPAYVAHVDASGVRGDAPRPGAHWLVGDSIVFGSGLEEPETVSRQLQMRLNVPVVNAGLRADNLRGAIHRAGRWLDRAKPGALWLLVTDNDDDPPAPWLDCDLPLVCRLRNWEFRLGAPSEPAASKIPVQNKDLSGQSTRTRAELASFLAHAHQRGVFVGIVQLGNVRPEVQAILAMQLVDAQGVAQCLAPEHMFAPAEHTNARGAACIAETLAAAWQRRDGRVHRLSVAKPDPRCADPRFQTVLGRLRDAQDFTQLRESECDFAYQQQVDAVSVRVQVRIGASGGTFVPFAAGIVGIDAPSTLTSQQYGALREAIQSRLATMADAPAPGGDL